jgi:hypothetical protein
MKREKRGPKRFKDTKLYIIDHKLCTKNDKYQEKFCHFMDQNPSKIWFFKDRDSPAAITFMAGLP